MSGEATWKLTPTHAPVGAHVDDLEGGPRQRVHLARSRR